jgi:hypothetical protein
LSQNGSLNCRSPTRRNWLHPSPTKKAVIEITISGSLTSTPIPNVWFELTYVGNNGVSIVLSNEILHFTRGCIFQPAASNEVICDIVLLGITSLAISNGHRPAIGAVSS